MASALGSRGAALLLRLGRESAAMMLTRSPIHPVGMDPCAGVTKQFFSHSAVRLQKPVEERVEEEPALPSMKSAQGALNASEVKDVSSLQRLEKCVNMCQLMGRIGSEPQLRGTEKHPVLLFSLATHTQYRDELGNMQQKTFWHRVAVFKSGLRETCFKYCRKGSRIYLTGEIQYSNVKDPETNYVRTVTSIVADDVVMLGGNDSSTAS